MKSEELRGSVRGWAKLGLVCLAFCAAVVGFAAETISITATPRYPWNGLVDLKFTIDGTSGTKYDTSFAAKDVAGGTNLTMKTLSKSDGTAANVAKEQLLPGTYNWVWDATADLGEGTVLEKVVVEGKTEKALGGVQLWKDGPYWAECNVGATRPEEYGYYFWWGDTIGYTLLDWTKRDYVTWVSSKGVKQNSSPFADPSFGYGTICATDSKSDSKLKSMGYIDSTGNLVSAYDAASVHLGVPWRMPTDAEMAALISKCDTEWTTRNGVYGRLVKGRGEYKTNSIFLPCGGNGTGSSLAQTGEIGCFWTSTPSSGYGTYTGNWYVAWYLIISSESVSRGNTGLGGLYHTRSRGMSVRAVRVDK